jgi:hypothetical protein
MGNNTNVSVGKAANGFWHSFLFTTGGYIERNGPKYRSASAWAWGGISLLRAMATPFLSSLYPPLCPI